MDIYGIPLDDWQEQVLQATLCERRDGKWQTPQIALSTPRQNGKSQLIVARALAGALIFGEETIIISAHQQDTAREVFGRITDLIDKNPSLADRIEKTMNALNREFIKFKNGSTIRFKARSTGGGRGFSCDCLLLDEAQILGVPAWSAILPTMSARPNPQVWLLGTPPTEMDEGEVFGRFRDVGLDGKQSRLAYLEWSADIDDDFDDPATWAKANPSFGARIMSEAIEAERASMFDEQFAMERLGIWRSVSREKALIDPDEWRACGVDDPPAEGIKSFGVKFSADGTSVAVAGALLTTDRIVHVELVGAQTGSMSEGTRRLVEWLVDRWRDCAAIVVDGPAHSGAIRSELIAAGISKRVLPLLTWPNVATGNAMFLDAVRTESITHLASEGQEQFDDSVLGTTKKLHGDKGAWSWVSIDGQVDPLPVGAASLALYGARLKSKNGGDRSVGNRVSTERDAVVM